MASSKDTTLYEGLLSQFIGEPDPLQAMLEWITTQMMQIEASQKVGASKGQHSAERTTYFSGTRVRRFDTRLGTMYLLVPKLRKGGYIPFFVTAKKRSEQALMEVVQEAFISGVSTRKTDRLAQALGIANISAGQVSDITRALDAQVQAFRTRPLEAAYPVLWIDALYEKIRVNHRVQNLAVLVVMGITQTGTREVLAVEPVYQEAQETYQALFQSLKERGLQQVWLCVSDAHRGLQAAIQQEFLGCSWQRCKVHFLRNILAKVSPKQKKTVAQRLTQIWHQPDMATARRYAASLINEYEEAFPEAMARLEEGLEDSLQCYAFSHFDARKVSSTNVLERLNREIRRRSRVASPFPSMASYLRLITCYLIEYTEDWSTGRSYISATNIEDQAEALSKAA
jgi:transposase-like protein